MTKPSLPAIAFASYTSPIRYQGMVINSMYLPMRDGIRLAADLHLPANLPAGDRIPTIIVSTRYWRRKDTRPGFAWVDSGFDKAMQFYVERGYAMLNVDVRGTGASFGTRRHEWDAEEIRDGGDIADWIIAQPWSNGRVGGYGTSYSGTTAELLAVPNHHAIKAVVPRFNEFDLYTDIAFPGGMYLRGFVEEWGKANSYLDANRPPLYRLGWIERLLMRWAVRGVKPVGGAQGRSILREAVAQHASNHQAHTLSEGIECRDDIMPAIQLTMDDYSVHRYQEPIQASGTVIYGWGGWFDAVTAHAVIHRFMSLKNPQIAVIGAWNHGANQHASPYCPQALNVAQHWHESLRFFDHFLREEATSAGSDAQARTLYYYTIGAERWNKTDTWPPAGISQQRWYLHADHLLAQEQPAEADAFDDYTIDFSATTGRTNRWYTQMGGGSVLYPDRAQADERLLTYTSAPLTADLEITGNAIITLYVKSTADDGAFFVYLEDVAPDGTVYYLTEGQLRAAHRRISSEIPPYVHVEPYHSFRRADLMPWVPGEIAEICVGLQPISALIRQGHRIRIAIAGADCDLFPRIPASGTPTISVQRNQVYGSHIDLPVMMREADHA